MNIISILRKVLCIVGGLFGFLVFIGLFVSPDRFDIVSDDLEIVVNASRKDASALLSASLIKIENNKVVNVDEQVRQEKKNGEVLANNEIYYAVTKVVDGDTLAIDMNDKTVTLRLIGIDTPETVDPRKPIECFGVEASNKAKELLAGEFVRIEQDPTQSEFDKYGRLLVYVYREDGFFFSVF